MPNEPHMRYSRALGVATVAVVFSALATMSMAADDNERPPIEYSKSTPDNCVSKLQSRLNCGESQLEYHDDLGYLPSLLKCLMCRSSRNYSSSPKPVCNVTISPHRPRAIYFNDDVYVGYCQSGDVLELSAVDPQLGAVFYTLIRNRTTPPSFCAN